MTIFDETPDELGQDGSVGHDVVRCSRGTETRTYTLRVVPGGAELWRITESDDGGTHSIKECGFTSSEETATFLEELRRALVAGGWREA
jgi:hypothetical protein